MCTKKKKSINTLDKKDLILQGKKYIEKLDMFFIKHIKRNKNTKHINRKLFYILRNPFIYVSAYSKISKNRRALIKGYQDDSMVTYFGLEQAKILAKQITEGTYKFSPAKRYWILTPGRKKKRPIDVPKQSDRIVQEAIRRMLEAIYEPVFQEFGQYTNDLSNNYGFRPNSSCWSAISKIKRYSQLCRIVIKSSIVSAYNNIDHNILLQILRNRITDKKFLQLIRTVLKSGIMNSEHSKHSFLGAPQGSIISPILFNIYMLDFDYFIYENFVAPVLLENQTKSKKGFKTPEYKNINHSTKKLLKEYQGLKNDQNTTKQELKTALNKYKKSRNILLNTQYKRVDAIPKGALYVRYINDWVLALTCTKREAEKIKQRISNFIETQKKMQLDIKKTKISRVSNGYDFLGFNIQLTNDKKITRETRKYRNKYLRALRKTIRRVLRITPDVNRIIKRLKLQKICDKKGKSIANPKWVNSSEYKIVTKYNKTLREIFNYYEPCGKFSKLYRISYILHYSCARTIARRKKISLKQVFTIYGKILKITINPENDKQHTTQFRDIAILRELKKKKST